jgi:hypothetical protein
MPDLIPLPLSSHRCWKDIVTGKIDKKWDSLALKIMMTRISNDIRQDSSPATIEKFAKEVRAFFEKNAYAAQRDLQKIVSPNS